MTGDVQLRPATVEDAGAVTKIHLAARASAPMPPSIHTEDEAAQWLTGRLQSDDEVWLAEVAGGPVGYARFTWTWLDDLYVDPASSGRGIGGALLDLVKARRPNGFCLWVFETNFVAREFYRRHGLVELERTDGQANEEKAPDIRMAWPGEDGLSFFRRLIDESDVELGDLLARRAALTRAAQQVKGGRRQRDPDREAEVVRSVASRVPALGEERVERIMRVVITESLEAARSADPQATVPAGGSRSDATRVSSSTAGGTPDR